MYYAVAKLAFEASGNSDQDRRELHSLIKKIEARFRICIRPSDAFYKDGSPEIAVALLEKTQNQINQVLSDVIAFCETSGFGRVEEEGVVVDSF
ncbi:MAG: hypothetical protein AB7T49_08845 [Oligoflexales bacterium]